MAMSFLNFESARGAKYREYGRFCSNQRGLSSGYSRPRDDNNGDLHGNKRVKVRDGPISALDVLELDQSAPSITTPPIEERQSEFRK